MNIFSEYFPQYVWWLQDAQDSDVADFCKVTLRRNLADHLFYIKQDATSFRATDSLVKDAFTKIKGADEYKVLSCATQNQLVFNFLADWGFMGEVGKDAAQGYTSLITSEDYSTACRTNDSDHLVLRNFANGLDFESLFTKAKQQDSQLQQYLQFAATSDFGYLTSCIADGGTGMHIHINLFLPMLEFLGETGHLHKTLIEKNVHFEPVITGDSFLLDAKDGAGALFRLRNFHSTQGGELDCLTDMHIVCNTLIQKEREARANVLQKDKLVFIDIIDKAIALLKSSSFLTYSAAQDIIGVTRLGTYMGLLPPVPQIVFRALGHNLYENLLLYVASQCDFDFPKDVPEKRKPQYMRALILKQELKDIID